MPKTKPAKVPVKVARSASTGRFVTKGYAASHKRTTVVETVRKGG